jgi:hypothetical protein
VALDVVLPLAGAVCLAVLVGCTVSLETAPADTMGFTTQPTFDPDPIATI